MKASKILEELSMNPDLANYFGVITGTSEKDYILINRMFGEGELVGRNPKEGEQYVYFYCEEKESPLSEIADFLFKCSDQLSYVFGYILE